MTKISKQGLEIIKHFEGCKLNAYVDPGTGAEPITIGYGNTLFENRTKVKIGDKITQEHAESLLLNTLSKFEKFIKEVVTSSLTQYQFDAIVCFTYNTGMGSLQSSTLLKKVNKNPSDPTIPDEFLKWNKAGGKVLAGLTRRRRSEAHLYKHGEVNFYNI